MGVDTVAQCEGSSQNRDDVLGWSPAQEGDKGMTFVVRSCLPSLSPTSRYDVTLHTIDASVVTQVLPLDTSGNGVLVFREAPLPPLRINGVDPSYIQEQVRRRQKMKPPEPS